MAVLTINNIEIACPSVMTWELETFDSDSGRGIDGTMQRTMVCHKQKLNLEWWCADLTPTQISEILKLLTTDFMMVKFFSPLEGQVIEIEMYVGNRNLDCFRYKNGVPQYSSMKFNLIER